MIEFNTDLEELKTFVRENGEDNNWNYAPNKLITNVLIQEGEGIHKKYKLTRVRFFTCSNAYYYTDERGDEYPIKYINKWCLIE